jgi:hypothetical protein
VLLQGRTEHAVSCVKTKIFCLKIMSSILILSISVAQFKQNKDTFLTSEGVTQCNVSLGPAGIMTLRDYNIASHDSAYNINTNTIVSVSLLLAEFMA